MLRRPGVCKGLSYRRTLIRLLDRPGGRFLLGKIATRVVHRAGGKNVQIIYRDGLWTRRVGSDFFPDHLKFDYSYADFEVWNHQMEHYEADTTEYWLQHYRPKDGDVIVDVGAGRGEDTITFSRAVGRSGRVIAIEAHPLTFSILEKFCRLNQLKNVTTLQLALMDRPGTVHVVESHSTWMENEVTHDGVLSGIAVRAASFDEICREHGLSDIAFLKMNIEGAERFALPGMEPVINCVRQICVACHDFRADQGHGESLRTRSFVKSFLGDHGFTVTSRCEDTRDWVRDHIFGLRASMR